LFQIHIDTGTAACCYVLTHMTTNERNNASQADFAKKNWDLVEKARVVYMSGFFITVSPEAIGQVAQHVADNDKILCMVRACL